VQAPSVVRRKMQRGKNYGKIIDAYLDLRSIRAAPVSTELSTPLGLPSGQFLRRMLWNFLEPASRSRMFLLACRWLDLNGTDGLAYDDILIDTTATVFEIRKCLEDSVTQGAMQATLKPSLQNCRTLGGPTRLLRDTHDGRAYPVERRNLRILRFQQG
jgi:hypothetical protein